jgi:DNA polymerase I-like protein with 3'-5' exonuclease and polymerase domains
MIAVLDTETTIYEKGNPFSRKNRLCYLGVYRPGWPICLGTDGIFHDARPILDDSQYVVGFNAKFDLHWLRRTFGWTLGKEQRIWDCQLAHFLLTGQRYPYPSLEVVRDAHGIERQSHKRSADYWDAGINTPEIPREIIELDLQNDLLDTYGVYQKQLNLFANNRLLFNLFCLHCDDLVVLCDMEWNGLNYDTQKSLAKATQIHSEIGAIEMELKALVPDIPINFDSPEHTSAFLYGGTIKETTKRLVGQFKTGARVGQPKYQNVEIEHVLPRIVTPLERSKLKKEGYWSVDESALRQLSGAKRILEGLLRRSTLSKELESLRGIPEMIEKKDWPPNEVHGQFNQCVARTGRLSSSEPNEQNMPDSIKQLIRTRYDS